MCTWQCPISKHLKAFTKPHTKIIKINENKKEKHEGESFV
jgi:hypothetical protein